MFSVLLGVPDAIQWLIGLSLILTALVALGLAIKSMWGFLRKFISTVDVIGGLEKSLATINTKLSEGSDATIANGLKLDEHAKRLDDHLEDAKAKMSILTGMQEQIQDVIYELKPNGGNSMADKVNSLNERVSALTESGAIAQHGIDGLYARPGEPGAPGRATGGSHNRDEDL